jgi:hypothetical protein
MRRAGKGLTKTSEGEVSEDNYRAKERKQGVVLRLQNKMP